MRLIDADALSRAMYHEAFETDSDWQRWDSGLWIRYKMFENALKNAPTIDAVPVVRCGECKKHGKNSCPMTFTYAVITDDNNYCIYAERRADEHTNQGNGEAETVCRLSI